MFQNNATINFNQNKSLGRDAWLSLSITCVHADEAKGKELVIVNDVQESLTQPAMTRVEMFVEMFVYLFPPEIRK